MSRPAFWRGFRRGLALQGPGEIWCGWTHGGGQIKRDDEGRINWQCNKCGRWSRYPVPLGEEQSAISLKSAAAVNHPPSPETN